MEKYPENSIILAILIQICERAFIFKFNIEIEIFKKMFFSLKNTSVQKRNFLILIRRQKIEKTIASELAEMAYSEAIYGS
ncbi:hypothetical protein BpHYR1_032568 [Brachionus plicatilis]|uniref:Uncharacterized protein n=1 Tax=Brachionus plicatilis TaxID=10195 RepID=A0A3M7QWQ1_BRAPC|nr:hypothetical protein BpHYR1_032568 [Brachionus plicatilis]